MVKIHELFTVFIPGVHVEAVTNIRLYKRMHLHKCNNFTLWGILSKTGFCSGKFCLGGGICPDTEKIFIILLLSHMLLCLLKW